MMGIAGILNKVDVSFDKFLGRAGMTRAVDGAKKSDPLMGVALDGAFTSPRRGMPG